MVRDDRLEGVRLPPLGMEISGQVAAALHRGVTSPPHRPAPYSSPHLNREPEA